MLSALRSAIGLIPSPVALATRSAQGGIRLFFLVQAGFHKSRKTAFLRAQKIAAAPSIGRIEAALFWLREVFFVSLVSMFFSWFVFVWDSLLTDRHFDLMVAFLWVFLCVHMWAWASTRSARFFKTSAARELPPIFAAISALGFCYPRVVPWIYLTTWPLKGAIIALVASFLGLIALRRFSSFFGYPRASLPRFEGCKGFFGVVNWAKKRNASFVKPLEALSQDARFANATFRCRANDIPKEFAATTLINAELARRREKNAQLGFWSLLFLQGPFCWLGKMALWALEFPKKLAILVGVFLIFFIKTPKAIPFEEMVNEPDPEKWLGSLAWKVWSDLFSVYVDLANPPSKDFSYHFVHWIKDMAQSPWAWIRLHGIQLLSTVALNQIECALLVAGLVWVAKIAFVNRPALGVAEFLARWSERVDFATLKYNDALRIQLEILDRTVEIDDFEFGQNWTLDMKATFLSASVLAPKN